MSVTHADLGPEHAVEAWVGLPERSGVTVSRVAHGGDNAFGSQ